MPLIYRCEDCGAERDPRDVASLYGPCEGTSPTLGIALGIHLYEQVQIADPPDCVPEVWPSHSA